MSAATRIKDKERAAYLKKMGITRNTGTCPMGCGAKITNGGGPLLAHLNVCQGTHRQPRV